MDPLDFREHVTQWAPENLDVNVSLKLFDGASHTWGSCLQEEQGKATLDQLIFLSLGLAEGNSSSSEPEMHGLLQFLS